MIKYIIGFLFIGQLMVSCRHTEKNKKEALTTDAAIPSRDRLSSEVSISPVQYSPLEKKLILNGSIQAHNKIVLKFDRSGIISTFHIRNGDHVKKGDVLTALDPTELAYDTRRLKTELELAELDRDERILLLGGEFGIDNTITKEQLEYIDIKSGVRRITEQLASADYQLSRMTTYVPYTGIVSDVMVRQFQIVNIGESICTLIDTKSYEAVFDALESSITDITIGQKIRIIPLASSDKMYTGNITRINPIVNQNGLVNIKSRISGNKNKLLQGQKIRIEIITKTDSMIVIPKKALVLRSGKNVVFTYDASLQLAKWKYVTIVHENDTELGISEGLNIDDMIITKGNLNLAHDAKVIVTETEEKERG
ncbi:MAG: efflux RND transporter periplasmic adaptor subunit [Saprospiraceae bacterium]